MNFGDQYRSAIFTHGDEQQAAAERSAEVEGSKRRRKIATQIVPAATFYRAEEYHQRYEEKSGRAACNTILQERLAKEDAEVAEAEVAETGPRKSEAQWRKELTAQQYRVLRGKGTERAFTGEYVDNHADGSYHCAGCDTELFSSDTKFDSRTGWPSFTDASGDNVKLTREGLILRRTEVSCKACGGHLGHVFNDGPGPTGQRYCINSCALDFQPQ